LKPARVFFYVQHLLGIGHLKRAATLARALAEAGLEVTLASGGLPVAGMAPPGVRLVQLPPASAADMTFKKLLDESGREIDADWILRRTAATHAAFLASDPDIMVLELFPFGRWQMAFELQSLLELALKRRRRPVVVCSVRDLLSRKRAAREREIASIVERYIDHVVVHADPSVIRLEQTFSLASRIAARIEYTGYVVDSFPEKEASSAGAGEVIVSAGGGAVGEALLDAAMHARHLTSLKDRTWRVLAGNNLDDEAYTRLGRLAAESGGGMVLERSRADFVTLLANCELSVSQAGYNTLMEAMSVRARAVVVPFAGAAETEQTLRARCFAERGLVEMLEESALTPAALAAAIDRAAARPKPTPDALDLDGARKSAALIARWAGRESE
jgi:predicted glycosyltransferase